MVPQYISRNSSQYTMMDEVLLYIEFVGWIFLEPARVGCGEIWSLVSSKGTSINDLSSALPRSLSQANSESSGICPRREV